MTLVSDPIPAATLIVMRDQPSGPPRILMIQRSTELAFAGGALVFPGGRIDAGDHVLCAGAELEHGPARVAAIRETIEEAGLGPCILPQPGPAEIAEVRRDLDAGRPFAEALKAKGLSLDLAAVTPFARWLPDFGGKRRFDTLFFLAEAPPGAVSADGGEAVRAMWMTAAEVLAEVNAGAAHAIFPTRRNLERLARFGSLEEARADAARHPIETITPWKEERSGALHLCIPEGLGYPVTSEPMDKVRRG